MSDRPNARTAAYWTLTLLVAVPFFVLGIANLMGVQAIRNTMAHLGYPPYLLVVLGTAKVLGAIAVVQQRYAGLREWTYAGFTFDLLGATASHLFAGDPVAAAASPASLLIIVAGSYVLNRTRSTEHSGGYRASATHGAPR